MNTYEKRINISVCKSNIKKNGAYFGRVCKNGKIGGKELLQELKRVAPYIEINMMQAGMEKLITILFDFISRGIDVDFFNLGTFSIATQGRLEISEAMCASNNQMQVSLDKTHAFSNNQESHIAPHSEIINECGDYDISESIGKNLQFKVKFTPSKALKKDLENVKMNLAIKKKRAPSIQKITFPIPQSLYHSPSFIEISGEGLKVAGDEERVGIYIENYLGNMVKISKTSILRNEPKKLLIMLEKGLKQNCQYKIRIITQYREGGNTQILRVGESDFIYKCASKCDLSSEALKNQNAVLDPFRKKRVLQLKALQLEKGEKKVA